MADDVRAQTTPVEVTQTAPMPSAEQKAPEAGQVDQGAARTEVSPQPTAQGLPDEASERTKREFEKLQSQLRQERDERVRLQTVFNSINPPAAPKPQQPTPLYDPTTGILNEGVFTDIQLKAQQAEDRARRAEAAVQSYQENQIRQKDEEQRQEAIRAYPELDSEGKAFDKSLHNRVRAILQDSLLNPGDYGPKPLTYKQAADIVRGVDIKTAEAAKQVGAQEAIEQLTPKEQASLEATGSPARRTEVNAPLPDLRARSRRGDIDAIVERLKSVPAVGRGQP